jgi:hypothetical protein
MDSPFSSDHGSIAGATYLLEESQIMLSQPCLVLQDMVSEVQANNADWEKARKIVATKWEIDVATYQGNSQVATKRKMEVAPSFIRNITKKKIKDKEANLQHSNHQKGARDAEAALDAPNKFISTILNADDTELKTLCQEKK